MRTLEVTEAVDSPDGFAYVLVMLKDISNHVWLHSTQACKAKFIAMEFINWCTYRAPDDEGEWKWCAFQESRHSQES